MPQRLHACLVVLHHRFGVGRHNRSNNGKRLSLGVEPKWFFKTDLAGRLTKEPQACPHGTLFHGRRVNHRRLLIGQQPMMAPHAATIKRVKRILAAARAEHPIPGTSVTVGEDPALVGVAKASRLS